MSNVTTPAPSPAEAASPATPTATPEPAAPAQPEEIGGAKRAEPTRFGDWELNGKCVDF